MTKAKDLTKSHVTIVSAKLGLSYEEKQIVLILFNTKNWMKAVEIAKSMEIASSAGGITRIINTAIGKHGNFILKKKGWGQPNTYRFNAGFFTAEANKFEGPKNIGKKKIKKKVVKIPKNEIGIFITIAEGDCSAADDSNKFSISKFTSLDKAKKDACEAAEEFEDTVFYVMKLVAKTELKATITEEV